jgi:hypothetical protein
MNYQAETTSQGLYLVNKLPNGVTITKKRYNALKIPIGNNRKVGEESGFEPQKPVDVLRGERRTGTDAAAHPEKPTPVVRCHQVNELAVFISCGENPNLSWEALGC